MNSKQFLVIGGLILVLLGVLGFVGVVGLLAAFTFPAASQKVLVMVLGVVGILVGLYSIFNQSFLGANLENPADTILHLAVGVWALYASMNKGSMATMS